MVGSFGSLRNQVIPTTTRPSLSPLHCTEADRYVAQKNGEISPRRQKTFSTSLSAALPTTLGTGSSTLLFSKDSRRLILATSFGSSIAIIDLPPGREEEFDVVKVFSDHADREGTREIRGKGGKINGEAGLTNGDVSMNGADSDEEQDSGPTEFSRAGGKPAAVTCLAISNNGKWLSSADLERKVCVFDLENLKVCFYLLCLAGSADVPSIASHYSTDTIARPILPRLLTDLHFRTNAGNRSPHQRALPLRPRISPLPPVVSLPRLA